MTLRTYDPNEVSIIFGGIVVEGFADGTFLSVESNEDAFSLQVGTDGEGTRSRTSNKSGRATFTLMQSSASNQALSALHNLDISTPAGDGIVPLLIKDNSGTSLYAAEKAWIVRQPTSGFGREAESREWIVETDLMIHTIGGN